MVPKTTVSFFFHDVCCEANRCKNLSPQPFRQLNEITLAWFLHPFSESLNSDFILHQDPKSYSIWLFLHQNLSDLAGQCHDTAQNLTFSRESGWIAKTWSKMASSLTLFPKIILQHWCYNTLPLVQWKSFRAKWRVRAKKGCPACV